MFTRENHPDKLRKVPQPAPQTIPQQQVSSIRIPRRALVYEVVNQPKRKPPRPNVVYQTVTPIIEEPQPPKIETYLDEVELYIVVTTYNRGTAFKKLMENIARDVAGRSHIIHIYDDASDKVYTNKIPDGLNVVITRFTQNRGKKGYWQTVHQIFQDAKQYKFKYFFQLPDDCTLVEDFFSKSISIWNKIQDDNKICLSTLLIQERLNIKNWTTFIPREIPINGGKVIQTQWNDMCYMCTRDFFDTLDWTIRAVPKTRWDRNKNMSSGVGQQITQRLNALRKTMYHVWDSLVIMKEAHKSVMNAEERTIHPHTSLHRDEYEVSHKVHDKVTLGVASIPDRSDALNDVIDALYDQVDTINVFLNNYSDVPEFLFRDKIHVFRSQDHGDMGDAGKFFKVQESRGYYFSVDDDIVYPKDYVKKTIEKIEKYNRRYVVSYHGANLINPPVLSYYKGRKQFHCRQQQKDDIPVHVGGTGVMAFHTDTVKIKYSDFKEPNMADIWMALYCQKNMIGIMCLARDYKWINISLKVNQTKTIYATRTNHDVQTVYVNSWNDWKIYAT